MTQENLVRVRVAVTKYMFIWQGKAKPANNFRVSNGEYCNLLRDETTSLTYAANLDQTLGYSPAQHPPSSIV